MTKFHIQECHTPHHSHPAMTSDQSILGQCPECHEDIPSAWVLIEYENDNGETDLWAECPACETVVSPK
jgi:hypothetical protein